MKRVGPNRNIVFVSLAATMISTSCEWKNAGLPSRPQTVDKAASGISKTLPPSEQTPAIDVDVKIAWDYQKFPGRVRLYGVRPDLRFDVSQTRVVSSLKDAPVTDPLSDVIKMKTGTNVSFVLVIENHVKQDLYFFASPHLVSPTAAAVRHRFECLCNHKVYRLPPGKIWYRIVRLDLEKGFDNPNLELRHTIVGLTRNEALTNHKDALYEKE